MELLLLCYRVFSSPDIVCTMLNVAFSEISVTHDEMSAAASELS